MRGAPVLGPLLEVPPFWVPCRGFHVGDSLSGSPLGGIL